jgi:hypothetical protein
MDEPIKTGKAHVAPALPSHIRGIPEGNSPGRFIRHTGTRPGGMVSAAWSTGINPDAEEPIDPDMPTLPPA